MTNIEAIKAACMADLDELSNRGGAGCEPWTPEIRKAADDVSHYLTRAIRFSRARVSLDQMRSSLVAAAEAEGRLPADWQLHRANLIALAEG